jgi:3-deoxy-D-manno-octulosonic-acid transferase
LPASSFYDPVIEQFCNGKQVLVCGSTWPPDEEFVAGYRLKQNNKKLKYIIAPHQIDEKHIQSIEALFNGNTVRYTKANLSEVENANVLIIDTIGKLAFVYRFANVSYIGGGFGAGIHNTLEAAIYGVPIVFGPNYRRFKEACDLKTLGAAFSFEEPSELEHILNKLLFDAIFSKTTGNEAFSYATKMSGATSRIIPNL